MAIADEPLATAEPSNLTQTPLAITGEASKIAAKTPVQQEAAPGVRPAKASALQQPQSVKPIASAAPAAVQSTLTRQASALEGPQPGSRSSIASPVAAAEGASMTREAQPLTGPQSGAKPSSIASAETPAAAPSKIVNQLSAVEGEAGSPGRSQISPTPLPLGGLAEAREKIEKQPVRRLSPRTTMTQSNYSPFGR